MGSSSTPRAYPIAAHHGLPFLSLSLFFWIFPCKMSPSLVEEVDGAQQQQQPRTFILCPDEDAGDNEDHQAGSTSDRERED